MHFLSKHLLHTMDNSSATKEISQGDVYWIRLDDQGGAVQEIAHPHVVIQDDAITHSRLNIVVVCGLTSNIKRASEPGNVLLEAGEASLSKPSVVVVSQVSVAQKAQLTDYIGSLSKQRVKQILAGMRFQQRSFFNK